MDIVEIRQKKVKGDLIQAASIVGITPKNAQKALTREKSRHHNAIVKALTSIIVVREVMFKRGNNE